jgi:hypothetical protein
VLDTEVVPNSRVRHVQPAVVVTALDEAFAKLPVVDAGDVVEVERTLRGP